MSVSFQLLSGSTNGRPIKVAASATPGTTIHTAHATSKDRIWLWATNTDSVARVVTIEFGGVTSPDDHVKASVPAGETIMLVPGTPLTGGLICKAFAAAANVINITGHVDRIT